MTVEGDKKGALFCDSSSISVELIRSLQGLRAHAEHWDDLAFSAAQQLPMLSYAWVSSYLQHRLKPKESWCCLIAYEGPRLVGVLPLVITPVKVIGLGRFLLRTPADSHTRSVDLLLAPGKEAEVSESFLLSLDSVRPGWYALELNHIPITSPSLQFLRGSTGRSIIVHELAGWGRYLATAGNFDDYRGSLGRNARTNLNKAANRLNRLGPVHTEFLGGGEGTTASFQRFMEVEASGWKGQAQSAIQTSQALVEFYTTLVERLSQRGWLEWHFLTAEGKTIAGHMAVRCGRSLIIKKIGFDERYARCWPGNSLMEQTIKRAFESDDTDEINMISDHHWHWNIWRMQKREYYHLWICPRRPLPLIAGALPRLTRNILRRIPFLRAAVRRARDLLGIT